MRPRNRAHQPRIVECQFTSGQVEDSVLHAGRRLVFRFGVDNGPTCDRPGRWLHVPENSIKFDQTRGSGGVCHAPPGLCGLSPSIATAAHAGGAAIFVPSVFVRLLIRLDNLRRNSTGLTMTVWPRRQPGKPLHVPRLAHLRFDCRNDRQVFGPALHPTRPGKPVFSWSSF